MAKNANGEGSIYKDKQGRWRAVISIPSVDRPPKRRYIYGQTRKESKKVRKRKDRQRQILHQPYEDIHRLYGI